LFHNATFFGSCIIHILQTGCAKIKKQNSGTKKVNHWYSKRCDTSWHYGTYRFVTQENITNKKPNTANILHKSLLNIIKTNNKIIITKAAKCRTVVVIDKGVYQ
jgi:hypothetical protein